MLNPSPRDTLSPSARQLALTLGGEKDALALASYIMFSQDRVRQAKGGTGGGGGVGKPRPGAQRERQPRGGEAQQDGGGKGSRVSTSLYRFAREM